jgi:hypothetical protein
MRRVGGSGASVVVKAPGALTTAAGVKSLVRKG